MDGLSTTLKFVHNIFVAIINFICSRAELVHKMQKLQFYRFYIMRIAGLCSVSQYGSEVDWMSESEVAVVACLIWKS